MCCTVCKGSKKLLSIQLHQAVEHNLLTQLIINKDTIFSLSFNFPSPKVCLSMYTYKSSDVYDVCYMMYVQCSIRMIKSKLHHRLLALLSCTGHNVLYWNKVTVPVNTSITTNYELHGTGRATRAPVAQTLQTVRQRCPCTTATCLYRFARFTSCGIFTPPRTIPVKQRVETTV
jgi:hypothetical protein